MEVLIIHRVDNGYIVETASAMSNSAMSLTRFESFCACSDEVGRLVQKALAELDRIRPMAPQEEKAA
ncbi:MAG TPA: hypothetical protein ENH62_09255 [Marinobacter sp.]|uniref:Uncharacterized protein n=1 Tax=marine sediment metagenome TaxID=412755 RepID=A0A0F9KYN5_9ZZZZ|nr:hypothetical protein [Marinobacter sp.]